MKNSWAEAKKFPVLKQNEVHIWQAFLAKKMDVLEDYRLLLSADEIMRANKMKVPRQQRNFILSRGILRCLLGGYTNSSPKNIQFAYTQQGKPYLPFHDLHFNITHSRNRALFALTRNIDVGIDIEYQRSNIDYMNIAKRFFTENENLNIRSQANAQQLSFFYQLWTYKEAISKASGQSFFENVGSLDVSSITTCQEPTLHESNTYVCDIPAPPRYTASLALQAKPAKIAYWEWVDKFHF